LSYILRFQRQPELLYVEEDGEGRKRPNLLKLVKQYEVYLKMEAEYASETTVSTSNTTPCHNTECQLMHDTESKALQEQM
jgi:hypothetical protein